MSVNDDDVKVTEYVKSATGLASNAQLDLAGNEIMKSYHIKKRIISNHIKSYHIKKRIISNIKKEVGGYPLIH